MLYFSAFSDERKIVFKSFLLCYAHLSERPVGRYAEQVLGPFRQHDSDCFLLHYGLPARHPALYGKDSGGMSDSGLSLQR